MLKQIDFIMNTTEYTMLYDGDKLTEEQALKECDFVGCGMGCEESLFPYYLIIEKCKKPILKCIQKHIVDNCVEVIRTTWNSDEE